MEISPDKTFKVIDTSWENIENQFTKMAEIIKPHVEILGDNTGIGSREGVGGMPWKALIAIAFNLIDRGFIKILLVSYESVIEIGNTQIQFENSEVFTDFAKD